MPRLYRAQGSGIAGVPGPASAFMGAGTGAPYFSMDHKEQSPRCSWARRRARSARTTASWSSSWCIRRSWI